MNQNALFLLIIISLLIACSGPKTDSAVNNLGQLAPKEQRIIYSLAEICSRALVEQAKLDSSSHVSLLTHLKELDQFDQHLYEAVSGSSMPFLIGRMNWDGFCCPCKTGYPPLCCGCTPPTFASSVFMKADVKMRDMRGNSLSIVKETTDQIGLFTLVTPIIDGEYLLTFEGESIYPPIVMRVTIANGTFKLRP